MTTQIDPEVECVICPDCGSIIGGIIGGVTIHQQWHHWLNDLHYQVSGMDDAVSRLQT